MSYLATTILSLDQQLFFLLNHLPHPAFFDALALFLSGIGSAGIVWFALAVILFWREEKKDHRFFLPFLATGALSWLAVEALFKPLVARLRPSPELGAIIVGDGSDGFSFPSGHATIAFALAYILSCFEPRGKIWFYLLASLISFSRIYLGVHYPLDVLAGGISGWYIGRIVLKLFPRLKTERK